jgi:anti-sigma factor RsiW
MEITRNVILDLLPLYSADEVSADTRLLVEKYLETDPELARISRQLAALERRRDIPAPLSQDAQMRAYRSARRDHFIHILIVAGAISVLLVTTVLVFFLSSS